MNQKKEPLTEFKLSKENFISNLFKIIPEMERVRTKAEEILLDIQEPGTRVLAPDLEIILGDLEKICSLPHRRIGTEEAHEIENFIEKQCKELGLKNVKKEPFELINWVATNWKLSIITKDETIEIPCFYVLNTEFTDKKGLMAPLVYVGTGRERDFKRNDVKDKIVVADIEFPTLPLGKLLDTAKPYYISDPTQSIDEFTEMTLTFALLNFPPQPLGGLPISDSVYWRAVDRGALGLILILRDYPSNINSHWGPYDGSMKPVPALYVGKYDGMKVRELAKSPNSQGNIILEGYKEKSKANNIWGILPGQSDEMIMVSSHHDSAFKGASEDGTGVAMVLAQLRAWAKIPIEKRPKSLLFLLTAGHLYGGIGAETFTRKYKDSILKNVMVDLNLEHMCAKEVEENSETHDFKLTDNLAIGAVFLSQDEVLIAHTLKAFKENKIERMILIPDNFFATPPIGEAGHFVAQCPDLKVIHWIRSPYYLLTDEDTLDKIDFNKLNPTAQCVADLINSLMYLNANKKY
ncbi:MAG: M28 family peptidase [Promethearchaeota archaeon]|nr:MAG: M28 family peptidase [Candidatus Lokiarchaeota archaeon]